MPGLLRERAYTVPKAATAAAIAPMRISQERIWPCLAGAMAVPAGLEAAPPAARPFCAAAAPTGSEGVCGVGLAGKFCVSVCAGCDCGLELESAGDAWAAPAGSIASGGTGVSAGTGCSGPFDGSTVTPFVCCDPLAAGADDCCAFASLLSFASALGCVFEVCEG